MTASQTGRMAASHSSRSCLRRSKALSQPVVEFRKIELAGAARNRAAVLDRAEEFVVFQRLQVLGTGSIDVRTYRQQVAHDGVEPACIDLRLALVALQAVDLVIEFLVHVTAYVTATEYGDDLEQAAGGSPGRPVSFGFDVIEHLPI